VSFVARILSPAHLTAVVADVVARRDPRAGWA
jgi:hypothetical protein